MNKQFKYLFYFILLVTIYSCVVNKYPWIGKIYRKSFEIEELKNFTKIKSTALQFGNNNMYGISGLSKDEKKILLIEKTIEIDGDTIPKFKILDSLIVSAPIDSWWMTLTPIDPESKSDDNIIALIVDDNGSFTTKYAWKIVLEDEKKDKLLLIPLETKKVKYIAGYEYASLYYDENATK